MPGGVGGEGREAFPYPDLVIMADTSAENEVTVITPPAGQDNPILFFIKEKKSPFLAPILSMMIIFNSHYKVIIWEFPFPNP